MSCQRLRLQDNSLHNGTGEDGYEYCKWENVYNQKTEENRKEYRGLGIGSQLMLKMLELLKQQGYEQASLAVQKTNYAVKMYKKVGFKKVDENAEEYIMVCEL